MLRWKLQMNQTQTVLLRLRRDLRLWSRLWMLKKLFAALVRHKITWTSNFCSFFSRFRILKFTLILNIIFDLSLQHLHRIDGSGSVVSNQPFDDCAFNWWSFSLECSDYWCRSLRQTWTSERMLIRSSQSAKISYVGLLFWFFLSYCFSLLRLHLHMRERLKNWRVRNWMKRKLTTSLAS